MKSARQHPQATTIKADLLLDWLKLTLCISISVASAEVYTQLMLNKHSL